MHPNTRSLAPELRAAQTLRDKIAVIENGYAGESCVVLSCGPSLSKAPVARLRDRLKGKLTIVVKQAIDVAGPEADFLCWNPYNVSKLVTPSSDTIRCFVSEPTQRMRQLNDFDLEFEQDNGEGDLERSLVRRANFDDYALDVRLVRPYGPGIMHELVFYLAVHLGVREILTLGWDIAGQSGMNTHYYDSTDDHQFFAAGRREESKNSKIARRVPEPIRAVARRITIPFRHHTGRLYNKTRVLPGETESVSASTAGLAEWLQTRGVRLRVCSDSPFIADAVPRISIEELLT